MKTYINLAGDRQRQASPGVGNSFRRIELLLLILVTGALFYGMRRLETNLGNPPGSLSFAETEARIESGEIIALNELEQAEQLQPALRVIEDEADRRFAADIILRFVQSRGRSLPNVGSLNGDLRIPVTEIEQLPEKSAFRTEVERRILAGKLAAERREKRLAASRWERLRDEAGKLFGTKRPAAATVAPFQGQSIISQIKPGLVVRRPAVFRQAYRFSFWLLIGALFLAHLLWSVTRFRGDQFLLPISGLLCGIGFLVISGMRDPLRDKLSFRDYTIGILAGLGGLVVASLSDRLPLVRLVKGWFRKSPRTPLLLALSLSTALVLFGSAPGGSDARVNLGPFQPVEVIRILVVFYLAAYFDRHWEFLRHLHQKGYRGRGLFGLLARFKAPRLVFFLPVVIAMGLVLLFFFLQRDLGPVLVLALVFLSLYAVARQRYLLIGGGLAIVLVGLVGAFYLGQPWTVVKRIHIFLDVWNNGLRGGDQIAHSLWALASGGLKGAGPGLGDTATIPAGHTDLIISSVGEEFGWVTVVLVLALYALLTIRSIRAALYSGDDYDLFLALGLTLVTGWQTLLITHGILGLFPLSGVVSPFLSWGKSSMIANFVNLGLIAAISARGTSLPRTENFARPVHRIGWLMGALALLVVAASGVVQVVQADDYALRGVLVELGDRSYAYQYNQRLLNAARIMKTGTIRDRNGVPLAASDCRVIEEKREVLTALGVEPDKLCQQTAPRLYPFGPMLFHLLGDLNTRRNWGAPATIYVEREYFSRLRGFNDRSERVPIRVVASPISDKEEPEEPRQPTVLEDAGEPSEIVIVRPEGGDESPDEAGVDSLTSDRRADRKEEVVIRRDYREILPLLRHRYEPDHPEVKAILSRDRDVRLSIDIRLQLSVSEILATRLRNAAVKRGAVVVIDPPTGDLLAAVSYPWPGEPVTPAPVHPGIPPPPQDELVDRAFAALRPPGSTFKIVTAMAALSSSNGEFGNQRFQCQNQKNGRVGMLIPGFRRAVLDASGDAAHGQPNMEEAIIYSCNAYFAQLGLKIGPQNLLDLTDKLGIRVTARDLERKPVEVLAEGENLLQAGYGQGQVVVTPFQMARVAATVANGGVMEPGRWVVDSNHRTTPAIRLVSQEMAGFLIRSMRGVVTRGTASNIAASTIAGKTGTAQVKARLRYVVDKKVGFRDAEGNLRYLDWKYGDQIPAGLRPAFYEQKLTAHGWFIGLAPFDSPHPIAFSVLMENGGSGRGAAAPVASLVVAEALKLGLNQ